MWACGVPFAEDRHIHFGAADYFSLLRGGQECLSADNSSKCEISLFLRGFRAPVANPARTGVISAAHPCEAVHSVKITRV